MLRASSAMFLLVAVAVALLFVSISGVSGHLCVLAPNQRTPLGDSINKAGALVCQYQTGPCGGVAMTKPQAIDRNTNYTIVFQKNANHWNTTNPGTFVVSFQETHGNSFLIEKIPDTNTPDLTLYTVPVHITTEIKGEGYVQVTYITNSVGNFYQCADVVFV
eukprot:TRINITY_DN420_c0_g1_i2.p1 TRINITY_DN420_c0_g1~~TRINITY_DN420_c0_g1_i2.p1  ORF type:complete len:162 (-),score=39.49 TRINITY_DN420_c0_g1_i2:75-560(-)